MLTAVQFPVADARPFAQGGFGRLARPDWPPQTSVNPQFVRRFGAATERRRDADRAYPDEHAYCYASRALKFGRLPALFARGAPPFVPSVAFRRLLVDDTYVVGRVEVGIGQAPPPPRTRFDETSAMRAVDHILGLRATVPGEAPGDAALIALGTRLARLYRRATTQNGVEIPARDDRLVEAGMPLVVVVFDRSELEGGLRSFRRVQPESVGGAGVFFCWFKPKDINGSIPVWLIRRDTATPDTVRRLRLCLMRLHAERECLDSVLRQIQRGAIQLDGDERTAERLQQFLNDATRLIARKSWSGLSQSAILAAFDASQAADVEDLDDLWQRLERARRQVTAKVRAYARTRTPRVSIVNRITNSTLTHSRVIVGQGITVPRAEVAPDVPRRQQLVTSGG